MQYARDGVEQVERHRDERAERAPDDQAVSQWTKVGVESAHEPVKILNLEMIRFAPRCCSLLVALALVGGCSSNRVGAVAFRWRIIDGVEGAILDDRCDVCVTSGAIRCDKIQVFVAAVELKIADAMSGADLACRSCKVACSSSGFEATTAFELKEVSYFFSLDALDANGLRIGQSNTPIPLRRDVRHGAITNLGAIEILIQALVAPNGDGGGRDSAVDRGG